MSAVISYLHLDKVNRPHVYLEVAKYQEYLCPSISYICLYPSFCFIHTHAPRQYSHREELIREPMNMLIISWPAELLMSSMSHVLASSLFSGNVCYIMRAKWPKEVATDTGNWTHISLLALKNVTNELLFWLLNKKWIRKTLQIPVLEFLACLHDTLVTWYIPSAFALSENDP